MKMHIGSFHTKMTNFFKIKSNRDRKLSSRLYEYLTNITTCAQKEQKRKNKLSAKMKLWY